jgi:hypothetical protein
MVTQPYSFIKSLLFLEEGAAKQTFLPQYGEKVGCTPRHYHVATD